MNYPDGSLLRNPAGTIFFVHRQQRYGIPDMTTFVNLGFEGSPTIQLSDAEIGSVPLAGNYASLPARAMISPAGTVFVLELGLRRGVPDMATYVSYLQAHGRPDPGGEPHVSDEVLNSIPDGGPLPHQDPIYNFCYQMYQSTSRPNQPVIPVFPAQKFQARSRADADAQAQAYVNTHGLAYYAPIACK